MSDVLPEGPKGGVDTLADGLQGFKARPLLGGVDAHTLCRVMIHRDKDRYLPILVGVCRRHIGPPHRIDLLRDDRSVMGFWAMRMALPRGGQQLVGPHQARHPTR